MCRPECRRPNPGCGENGDVSRIRQNRRDTQTWADYDDRNARRPYRCPDVARDPAVNDSFVEALAKELPAEIFAMDDGTFVVDIRMEDGRWVTGLVRGETMNSYEADWAGLSEAERSRDVEGFAALLILEADAHTNKQWPLWLA